MVVVCPCQQSNIDFDKIKWGSFTKQFQAFKRQEPSSKIDNLGEFADYIISHPNNFKKTTLKRANFYKNVIEKKGGESKGFFGNIKRAFETSWNKKPTEQEKPILKGIFDTQKVLTDNIIKPLAPPVGYVADKQRQFLEDKYLGSGTLKRHL